MHGLGCASYAVLSRPPLAGLGDFDPYSLNNDIGYYISKGEQGASLAEAAVTKTVGAAEGKAVGAGIREAAKGAAAGGSIAGTAVAVGASLGLAAGPLGPLASAVGAAAGAVIAFFAWLGGSHPPATPEQALAGVVAQRRARDLARIMLQRYNDPKYAEAKKVAIATGYINRLKDLAKADDKDPLSWIRNPSMREFFRQQYYKANGVWIESDADAEARAIAAAKAKLAKIATTLSSQMSLASLTKKPTPQYNFKLKSNISPAEGLAAGAVGAGLVIAALTLL